MRNQKECPICGSARLDTLRAHALSAATAPNPRVARLLDIYASLFLPAETNIINLSMDGCMSCGFIFTNPRLSETDLDRKYAVIAGEDKQHHKEARPPHLEDRRTRVTPFLLRLLSDSGYQAGGKVLDYGGAEGYLLSPLIDAGHAGYVSDYIDYDREDGRIHYLGKKLGPKVREHGPYTCILLLHTLEHVADPVGMLRDLTSVLSPKGKLYVEVPLGAWMEWQHLREPLTHVNFFSEQSISRAAIEAGLHVHAVNSEWQYVTQTEKTPCINLVAGLEPATAPVRPATTIEQMQLSHQLWNALAVNPRYYGKLAVKSLF